MPQAMPEDLARSFVRSRYGTRATAPRPLAAGEWSRAFAFRLDGREAVIRFGTHGEDFAKDAAMGRRGGPDLPIPPVWELGDAPGGCFAVSERRYGDALDGLDAAGMRLVLPALLRTCDAIARVDVSASRGYGGWGPDGTAPCASWAEALLAVDAPRPRLPGWRERLDEVPEAAGAFAAALAALRGALADLPDPGRGLIHNDLLHHNVLVDGDRITAVLDWGNAMYGDPLYDAAWLLYWWPWYPAWAGIPIRDVLDSHWEAGGGRPARQEGRLRCCLLHIGLDHLAYTAFAGRRADLLRTAAQVRGYL